MKKSPLTLLPETDLLSVLLALYRPVFLQSAP